MEMKIRGLFASVDISTTGLMTQRKRMDAIAENIANVETTRTPEGGPYKRRVPFMVEDRQGATTVRISNSTSEKLEMSYSNQHHMISSGSQFSDNRYSGVKYQEGRDDTTPEFVYDPNHPDANEFGYVAKPKINIITEMVELIASTRNYEANVSAIDAAKNLARKALEI